MNKTKRFNTVTMEEYEDATERYIGYCTTCREFTRDCTEPDAEDYDCPECGQNTVVGAEQGLLLNFFEIED